VTLSAGGKPISQIVNELVEMEFKGDLIGLACVAVTKDGDARTLFAFDDGGKFAVFAGVAMLQSSVMDVLRGSEEVEP